jgi:hypothetical protein
MEEIKMKHNEIHNKICYTLFSNLSKYVKIGAIQKDTPFNWITIKKHIDMMSQDYKIRNNIEELNHQKRK